MKESVVLTLRDLRTTKNILQTTPIVCTSEELGRIILGKLSKSSKHGIYIYRSYVS